MLLLRPLSLIVAAGLVAAACGGGSDSTATSTTQAETSSTTADTTPATTAAPTAVSPTVPDLAAKPVIITPGGEPPTELVTDDLVVGDGEEAVAGSLVQVHYVGVRYSDGVQFDASWDRDQTFEFVLGASQVIQGWEQGVAGMKVGGRRELIIPPALAYGDRGAGEAIGPGESLIFVVDLVSIVPDFPVPVADETGNFLIPNQGGEYEGHTPVNMEGQGTGLFAGDQVSETFPTDDGVEIILTFNVAGIEIPADATVVRAELISRAMQAAGTPFDDLGPLIASPIDYDTFPPTAQERDPIGPSTDCEAFVDEARLTCDVTAAVTDLLDGNHDRASFRLRFSELSDMDGEADLAVFFFRDPNSNERGIFTLEIEFG